MLSRKVIQCINYRDYLLLFIVELIVLKRIFVVLANRPKVRIRKIDMKQPQGREMGGHKSIYRRQIGDDGAANI